MKSTWFLPLLTVVLFSCKTKAISPLPPLSPLEPPIYFIDGVYATNEQSDFCSTWDTLTVHREAADNNLYQIWRHTSFQRNLEDDYFPVERYRTSWTGMYDNFSHIMRGIGNPTDIIFIPDQYSFRLNGNTYTRVE